MSTLHIYSNMHIKNEVKNIKKGDFLVLENSLSKKRWELMFKYNHINEDNLNLTYLNEKEFFNLKNIEFDVVVGNPPYTKGSQLLYTKFFEKALEVGKLVSFVMPVQLDSLHDKLKKHNFLLKKHLVKLGENVSDKFNVGYNTIHHVTASKTINNAVEESIDPIDKLPILYPNRRRLNFIKGDTDTGQTIDNNGVIAIDKIHKGDKVIWRKIPQSIYNKSNKKSTAPFLVCVNHTPSQGKFNCAIIKNVKPSYTWAIWTFVLEADTLKEANNLKKWLKSDIIVNEIKSMFSARGDAFYTVSKKILDRLPYYKDEHPN